MNFMLIDAQEEKNSPLVLAQTLIAIGRIVSDLESDLSTVKWELEKECEDKKTVQGDLSKVREAYSQLMKKYHEASDVARFETAKALAARTLLMNLIEDKKLKGKDLKAAKEALSTNRPTLNQVSSTHEHKCDC